MRCSGHHHIDSDTVMKKPRRRCVYCGEEGVTKEHLYGKWSRKFSPLTMLEPGKLHRTEHLVQHYPDGEIAAVPPEKPGAMNRPGQLRSQTLQIACRECNGGWMKKVLDEAMPMLKVLDAGYWGVLDERRQTVLSAWVAMFCSSYEFADLYTVTVSQMERDFLRRYGVPSRYWRIAIGFRHGIAKNEPVYHRAFSVRPEIHWVGERKCGATALSFGNLIAVAFHSERSLDFPFHVFCAKNRLVQIWPIQKNAVRKPFAGHFGDSVDQLIEALTKELNGSRNTSF